MEEGMREMERDRGEEEEGSGGAAGALEGGGEEVSEAAGQRRAVRLWRELGEELGVGTKRARRRTRSDAGQARLTWRDLQVLRFIGEQYAVTHEQLGRLLARFAEDASERERVSSQLVYRMRARWVTAGLVEARAVIAGEPSIVWLTARGRELVELDVRSWRPTMNTIRHVPAVTEARLFLESQRPDGEWVAERLLGRDQGAGGGREVSGRRPDGEFRYEDSVLAVEVELSAKKETRLRSIVRDRLERYDAVWYFAPAEPTHLRELITRVASAVYAERVERAAALRRQGGLDDERRAVEVAKLERRPLTLRALDGEKLWTTAGA